MFLYVRIYVHVHLCLCICTGICTSMNKCIFLIYVCLLCVYIFIYIYVCNNISLQCIYIHIYIYYTCACILYIYVCVCIIYAYYVQICYRVGINIVRHHKTHPKIHAHSFWAHGNETNGACDQTMWENHFIHYFVLESHRSHGLSLRLCSLLPKRWLKLTGRLETSKSRSSCCEPSHGCLPHLWQQGRKISTIKRFLSVFLELETRIAPARGSTIYILPKPPDKNIHKVFIPGPPRRSHKNVKEGPSRGSYKLSLQEPRNSVPEGLSPKHLKYRASSISFCKDLLEDFTGISTTSSHKDLYKILVKIFMYEDLCKCATRLWQDRYSTTFEF